jgi:hypothetical protein
MGEKKYFMFFQVNPVVWSEVKNHQPTTDGAQSNFIEQVATCLRTPR